MPLISDNGTPARRLVERGAATTMWEASALGLPDRVEAYFSADPNWIGWDDLAALDVVERSEATDVVEWLRDLGAKSARELRS